MIYFISECRLTKIKTNWIIIISLHSKRKKNYVYKSVWLDNTTITYHSSVEKAFNIVCVKQQQQNVSSLYIFSLIFYLIFFGYIVSFVFRSLSTFILEISSIIFCFDYRKLQWFFFVFCFISNVSILFISFLYCVLLHIKLTKLVIISISNKKIIEFINKH